MKLLKDRRPGAFFGMSMMLLLPVSFGAWAVTVNPWFMDQPLFFALLVLLPCALVGAVIGALLARAWFSRTLLSLNIVGVAWIFFHPVPQGIDGVQLMVYGMDGATWSLIDKMDLPNIEALQETGSRAVLMSEEPMLSPLLWTTMATGQHPDQHGIRGFNTSADKIEAPRVWDIAAMEGRSVGLYKWLVTHPAKAGEAGGFVVPAWLASDTQTDPEELGIIKQIEFSNRLKRENKAEALPTWKIPLRAIPQGLRFSTLLRAGKLWAAEKFRRPGELKKARDMQLLRVWMDRDFFLAQLHRNPTHIATFTTYATDALSHTHWKWMSDCHNMRTLEFTGSEEDCPEWSRAIPEAYQQADQVLGEILDEVGWDTHVVVLSDHGFRAADEEDAGHYFVPLTTRLEQQLEAVIGPVMVQRLGKKLIVSLEDPNIETQRAALLNHLEHIVSGDGDLNPPPLFKVSEFPDSRSTIGLTFRDENMSAERLAWERVIDNLCYDTPLQENCDSPLTDYAEPEEASTGEHDAAGIILASGPDIEPGVLERTAELVDIAPTLLTLIGLPASEEMVGEVLWGNELIRVPGEEYWHLAPTSFMEYTETGDAMTDQLEALGYID
jgi:hypothetical protein